MSQSCEQVWGDVLSLIKEQINEQSFTTWFDPLKPVAVDKDTLTLEIPNRFFSEWIDEHYHEVIYDALGEVMDSTAKISYAISKENGNGNGNGSAQSSEEKIEVKILPEKGTRQKTNKNSQLNLQYSFDTFVEGPSNQFAHAVAIAVSDNPGKSNFNPLLIWGGVGLGKTHIAQAIGIKVLKEKKVREISYISSKQFMVDFINSVRNNKREEFSKQFEKIDLLIVDDIEFFINKTETQIEFFHIFNTLHLQGKQIVLTSDRPPRDFQGAIQERLTSRFQNGLVVDVKPPDLETRVAILQRKALDYGVELDSEVALLIATHIKRNIRELQGALNHMMTYSSVMKTGIDTAMAKRVLKELKYYESKPLSIEDIQKVVSEFFGINANMLREKTRKKEIVIPRQVAMYLVKELTNNSLKTIGLHFGGRDHSTVLHAINSVQLQVDSDGEMKEIIGSLKQKVNYSREI